MNTFLKASSLAVLAVAPVFGFAQHLWWQAGPKGKDATCLYGRITVLSTSKTIYYCGANWWPGNPAGGYTGIQDEGGGKHRVIFSIWDTSPTLHPKVTYTADGGVGSRFGGEGTGAHSHIEYDWKVGQTYQFFAVKVQDPAEASTVTTVFFFDEGAKKWVKEATISSPNGGFKSVQTFGGGGAAFLENWSGQDRALPKLAEYQLWLGTDVSGLEAVTKAGGDGKWGVLNNRFFLAEGDDAALAPLFDKYKGTDPFVERNGSGTPFEVKPIKLSKKLVSELQKLLKSVSIGG